jgi:sigma-B regulation protein RsbU (phosphoserine phosphatase)
MTVVLVMMVVITGLVFFTVRHYMLEEAQERYEGVMGKNCEEFRRHLSDIYVAAKNNTHDIERDIDHPDMMYDHMRRIVSQNSTVRSCAILFSPGYYPDKQHFFVPMVRRDSVGELYVARTDSANTYDRSVWFRKCMESDTAMWVGTYFDLKRFPDKSRRTMLTTYATPIHDRQGKPVGLLCLQLSVQSLRNAYMKEIKRVNERYEQGQEHKSYSFVIDRHGNYIMHPDEKRILNASFLDQTKETADAVDDRVVARMVKGENGEAMMEVDGKPAWIYYRTIRYVNWTMVIVVPEETIFHNGLMLNTIILLTMLLGLAVIILICWHTIRQTTKPLHSFALSADEVALGNFTTPLPDVQGSDEVRMLHDAFENMRTSLSIYVDELQATVTTKASLERELKIAHGIQMAMLPKPMDTNSDCDLFASLTPAREVGGDLYDYFIRDGHLFFCVGDVSGKGVPAALVMAVTRSLFHSIGFAEQDPKRIVWRINRAICDGNEAGMFVTMFVGVLDLATGLINYCNAGHEAPLLLSGQHTDNSGRLPVKPNLPVGALSDWTFESQQAQMQAGDMLFLYTDGLSEAKNDAGQQLGRRHVVQLADEHAGDTARQLVQLMEQEVHRHAAGTQQSDDITLLAIKWNPATSHNHVLDSLSMHATMSEIDRLKPYVEDIAQQAGIDTKETRRLRLAVEETVANVINYGQASAITLSAETANGQLLLTIDDDGIAFDPTQESTTDLSVPADERPAGGMGIVLLHTMTNSLSYQRTDGHNILTIVKNI